MFSKRSVLDYGGFPALSDLQDAHWRSLFAGLEQAQTEFLTHEISFRSAEYRWPRDPLHTWSRLWEYPYVIHHLSRIRQTAQCDELLKVADVGSGVTFFPFSVARLGYDVTCVDIDPVCARDIAAATKVVAHAPGKVNVRLMDGKKIPLADESQDAVYCISVLEHIPQFEDTIDEIARTLKRRGTFVLTVDVDLRGDAELGGEAFDLLLGRLERHFSASSSFRIVHPTQILTSANSIRPIMRRTLFNVGKAILQNACRGGLFDTRHDVTMYLTVFAATFQRT